VPVAPYDVANMSEGDYPSDDQLSAFVEQECVGAFATYVGLSYDTSTLDVVYFTPSSDAWKSRDRSVQCAAYDPGDTAVVGTLHGAAR
jgi:hypothetical protein